MLFTFSTPVLVRPLWQLKTVVFLHWCLMLVVLLHENMFVIKTAAHFCLGVVDEVLIRFSPRIRSYPSW